MKRSNQQFTGIKYGPNKILGEKIKNKNKKNIIIVIWQNDIKFLSVHHYINEKEANYAYCENDLKIWSLKNNKFVGKFLGRKFNFHFFVKTSYFLFISNILFPILLSLGGLLPLHIEEMSIIDGALKFRCVPTRVCARSCIYALVYVRARVRSCSCMNVCTYSCNYPF